MANKTANSASVIETFELRDPTLVREVNRLRALDNVANWAYIVREYVFLAVIIAPVLLFYHQYDAWGVAWWWHVPVTLLAVLLIGVIQHRLVMLGHEASHYLLFRNKLLNDTAANWLCFFPLWSMCYNYRLQHLAHHQFTNDPEQDPDLVYMETSRQQFHDGMPAGRFWWNCVIKLFLWLPGLIHYVFLRAKLANLGGMSGPYAPVRKPSRLVRLTLAVYTVTMIGLTGWMADTAAAPALTIVALSLLGVRLGLALIIPDGAYLQTGVRPVISRRWALFQRSAYFTLLFTSLGYLQLATGAPWGLYYLVLWVAPIFTSWSFFMILREDIQHSNAPQGKFVDTRDFAGNWLIKWVLFPLNMDLHLPHHLFPMVPHYNLQKLNGLLQRTAVYRDNRIVVHGFPLPELLRASDGPK